MPEELPDWERLFGSERHLQAIVPGTVLVGGTAAALHTGHRQSLDGDHVLEDLRPRFDEVLGALEAAAGWQTSRVQRPVAILGRLDGVMTGIRQLRRTRPLESEIVSGLRVPTLPEMARIKAWLLATRHTVRDYLDLVVLLERLGESKAPEAFASFDEIYAQPSGASSMVVGAAILGRLPYFGLLGMAGVFVAVMLGFEEPNTAILLVSGLLMLIAPLAAAVHLTLTSEMTREEKRLWVRIFSSPRAFGALSPYLTSLDRGATARRITAQDSK